MASFFVSRVDTEADRRLDAAGGPALALLSHTDTVLADPAEWQRDPWSGDLVDGGNDVVSGRKQAGDHQVAEGVAVELAAFEAVLERRRRPSSAPPLERVEVPTGQAVGNRAATITKRPKLVY